MTGAGLTLWLGPGYVLHVSTEGGWQFERAEHRTWRLGILFAVRRAPACAVCQRNPPDAEGIFCSKRCLYRYRTALMDLAAWPSVGLREDGVDGVLSHTEYMNRRAGYFANLRGMVARVTAREEAASAEVQALAVPPYMTINETRAERGLPPLPDAAPSPRPSAPDLWMLAPVPRPGSSKRWSAPGWYGEGADTRVDLSGLPGDRQSSALGEFLQCKPPRSGALSLRATRAAWRAQKVATGWLFVRNMVSEVSD